MMDYEMRWQRKNTDSVIARLMGLDELPPQPQQHFHEKHRILSDSFIRKAASVGLRRGSFVSSRRHCRTNSEMQHETKGVSGVEISNCKHEAIFDRLGDLSAHKVETVVRRPNSAGASVPMSLSGASYKDRKISGKKGNHSYTRGSALRYLPKLENNSFADNFDELGNGYMNRVLDFQLEMIEKPCVSSNSSVLKPILGKLAYDYEDVKLNLHPRSGYGEHGESLCLKSGKHHLGLTYKELLFGDFMSPRHGCTDFSTTMNIMSHQGRSRSISEKTSSQGYMSDNYLLNELERLLLPSGLKLKRDDSAGREHTLKEQKFSLKGILEPKCGRSSEQFQTPPVVSDTTSPCSKVSELSSCYFSCFGSEYSNPEAYAECIQDEMDIFFENGMCEEIQLGRGVSKSSDCNLAPTYINSDTFASAEASNRGVCSRINDDYLLESTPVIFSGEAGQSSHYRGVLSTETSSNEFHEDESAYSNSSRAEPPEFQDDLKLINRSPESPDSVLEPFERKHLSSLECFGSIGLQLQLDALDLDREETYSEGSVMALSGDEDTKEGYNDASNDGRNVHNWLGDTESRNFSYLVDVLDEAGFHGTESFMDFKIWKSLKCPISPSVFEALEKKYGKQTSWQKSERQLFFDRLNSGLANIFSPFMSIHACAKSLRRRFCSDMRRGEVEDELWKMLTSQENEGSRDLSEMDIGTWLQLEEGISIICREVEASLFDELVMEFTSLCD